MDPYFAQPGTIITFYSYKGGTGRSMALANTACLLAERLASSSQKVLMMDWDLEAPGLHRFFTAQLESVEHADRPGIIDYFHELWRLLSEGTGLYEKITAGDGWKILDDILPIDNYLIPSVVKGADLIKAGRFDPHYAELVGSFDWVEFYNKFGAVIEAFRDLLVSKYAYCLVDSRTGLSDISGVCTMLLPEKLVAVFTPNRQSLDGVLDLVISAVNYRRSSDDFRPLAVFPLPSRVELAEKILKERWRAEYQRKFEEVFRQVYGVKECNLTAYFDEVQLPHMSYYAYGENIAVLEERSEALSLRRTYEVFNQRLIDLSFAWEQSVSVQPVQRQVFIEYVDFEVAIKPEGDNAYGLTLQAPGGTAQGKMLLPTSNTEYQEFALRLARRSIDEEGLTHIGSILFDVLFQGQIKEIYTRSRSMLQTGQRLRIKLNIAASDSKVVALPWEYLYDPDQGQLALLGASIVRYLSTPTPILLPTAPSPLNVLLTGAAPRDILSTLNVEQELSAIQAVFTSLHEQVQITIQPHLSTSKLQKRMRQRGFDIWHFVGHDGSRSEPMGKLFLEDDKGLSEAVTAKQLGIMLGHSGLKLAMLEAGSSAWIADDLYRSVAPALIRAQVPTVVAMQDSIQQVTAKAFTEEFYRALAEGHPIDTCMTEGRKAVVNAAGLGVPDWGIPVMYTSVPNSWRFELPMLSI